MIELEVIQLKYYFNLRMTQLNQYNSYVYIVSHISPSNIIFTCDTMCTHTIHVERNIHIYIVVEYTVPTKTMDVNTAHYF